MAKKVKKKVVRKQTTEEPDLRRLRAARPYVVSLQFNETRVVRAKSEADAWAAYKKLMGIRYTEHEPKIGFAPKDMDWDEETGKIIKPGVETADDATDDDFDIEAEADMDAPPDDDEE